MTESTIDIWATAPSYVGVKQIKAVKMNLVSYNMFRGWDIPDEEEPLAPGYVLQYEDGYVSWSPKEQFETTYMTGNNLSFSAAVYLLKQGKRLARAGWNGKNMWVSMTPGKVLDVSIHDIWTDNIYQVAVSNGGTVELSPYMSLKTADNKIQIGWVPSQSDTLAEDWSVVE